MSSPSYDAVEARRELEIEMIKEKLERNESVETPVCRVERVSTNDQTLRFGLKRGKLLYLFKYPTHDIEDNNKHRNVITRARIIKDALEAAGYRLIPWDFKKSQPPSFWDEAQRTMEEEDDDLYGPSETVESVKQEKKEEESDGENGDAAMHESEESEEESESESDLEIIIDKPQVAPKPLPQQESKAIKIEAPSQQAPSAKPTTTAAATSATSVQPTLPSQDGNAFPPVRSSTIDVNAEPIYPPVGKPISQIDIDADLAESTKPWRLPGADQSDYFNYGFDEFTWVSYISKQQTMRETLEAQKLESAQFSEMFGSMGAMPTGPGMPGMPGPMGPSADGGAGAGAAGANVGVPGAPTGPAAAGGGGAGAMLLMPPEMVQNIAMMSGVPLAVVQAELDHMQVQGETFANMDLQVFIARVQARATGGMGGGYGGPHGGYGGQGRGGGGRRGRW